MRDRLVGNRLAGLLGTTLAGTAAGLASTVGGLASSLGSVESSLSPVSFVSRFSSLPSGISGAPGAGAASSTGPTTGGTLGSVFGIGGVPSLIPTIDGVPSSVSGIGSVPGTISGADSAPSQSGGAPGSVGTRGSISVDASGNFITISYESYLRIISTVRYFEGLLGISGQVSGPSGVSSGMGPISTTSSIQQPSPLSASAFQPVGLANTLAQPGSTDTIQTSRTFSGPGGFVGQAFAFCQPRGSCSVSVQGPSLSGPGVSTFGSLFQPTSRMSGVSLPAGSNPQSVGSPADTRFLSSFGGSNIPFSGPASSGASQLGAPIGSQVSGMGSLASSFTQTPSSLNGVISPFGAQRGIGINGLRSTVDSAFQTSSLISGPSNDPNGIFGSGFGGSGRFGGKSNGQRRNGMYVL